ncbi:MAG: HNH endonuclease [Clostridia bacterium]|nr:HNH endonuclease [Clostridia bacterium]
MMKKLKLDFELVPEELWYANLRSMLSPQDWDVVRRDAYKRAGHKCRICGAGGRMEAHEKWSYDDELALQKLDDVLALCHNCHLVKHIGRAQLVGQEGAAMEHFMKVNRCSQMDYHEALAKVNEEYARRNKIEGWTTDVSWLKTRFGLDIRLSYRR